MQMDGEGRAERDPLLTPVDSSGRLLIENTACTKSQEKTAVEVFSLTAIRALLSPYNMLNLD